MVGMQNGNGASSFENAGKAPGICIWSVESKLNLSLLPEMEHGRFHSKKAYLLLHEEARIATDKSLELDDSLKGRAVLHREVQGYETKLFLSYFKGFVKYSDSKMSGGQKKLFRIKGRRNCRVNQVEFSTESLNTGDVYILDTPGNIYLWLGPDSNHAERLKGAIVAQQLRTEDHEGRAIIHTIEEDWNENHAFFHHLNSEPGANIKSSTEGGDDAQYEKRQESELRLFKVCDASGRTVISEVSDRPLHKKHLDTKDCFILDAGISGVYVWEGNNCTENERKTAWRKALEFLKRRGYPNWTPLTRLHENAETPVFKLALQWPDESVPSYERSAGKITDYMPDNGDGEVEVWRVENFFLVPVGKKEYGTFYSGDCYVVLYRYHKGIFHELRSANVSDLDNSLRS